MKYVFLDRENVFLEDHYSSAKKIEKEEILKHIDLPVVTLNLYVESFFSILQEIGLEEVNSIFKLSLNGYKVEDLIEDLNKKLDDDTLIFNHRIEASWFTSTEFDHDTDGEELTEFVKIKGWDQKDYFSIGKHELNELKRFIININNRYVVEDCYCNIVFEGIKRISLRMLIDAMLYEITINRNNRSNINEETKYVLTKIDKKEAKEAKLKLVDLQKELEIEIEGENYERCADIRNEIEKYDKIIKDGK